MSPEQITARAPVDGRSDVFSLGMVLVELVSGVHPLAPDGFANENVFTVVQRLVSGPPVSLAALAPWVPPFVAATIDRALARAPAERHASASAFAAALSADIERLERQVGESEPLTTLVQHMGGATTSAPHPETTTVELPTVERPARQPSGDPDPGSVDDEPSTLDADTGVLVKSRPR
jgi:serine/threonine protein kinase